MTQRPLPPATSQSRPPITGSAWRDVEQRIPKVARRLDARLLVPVLGAWPLVAWGGLLAPVGSIWGAAVACACFGGLVLARPAWRALGARRLLALTLAVCALALFACAGHRSVRTAGPVDELASQQAVVSIRGLVAAEPRPVSGKPGHAPPQSDEQGGPPAGEGGQGVPQQVVVRVEVSHVDGRGLRSEVSSPVLVMGDQTWATLPWHTTIEAVVRLSPAEPGDDVVAMARPTSAPRVVEGPGLIFELADSARADFRDATSGLPADARGLVPALVIGDTSRTPDDLTAAMLETGMSHLSAVSGSNVTLVLAAAMALCGLVGVRRRARPAIALAVLACFVVLARPEPSVVRAAVMGAVGLLALSTSRRRVGVPALAGAIVMLLVWDPWLARSYGFALSSVATLGLLLFAQPWGKAIARGLPARLKWFGPVLAVPVAAQAVCAPIVVPLQGSVSFIAVLANLLAAPLVAPTTIVGVAIALVSLFWTGAAGVLAWGAGLPALGIAWVARACARAPMGSIVWDDSALGAVVLAGVTAAVIVIAPWAWHRGRLRPLIAVAVVALTAAFMTPTAVVAWPPPGWVLVACDVGQGDALVVNTGPGHAIVVDAGPDPAAIDGCLGRLGVDTVDLVVLTHFHADHVGGLIGVLDGRRVSEIRVSPVREPAGEADRVDRLARAVGVPVGTLRAGDAVQVADVRADIWWPARQINEGSVSNNGSVVMTVHARGVTVLMAGDMEREAAANVLREARRDPARWGRIDVLKVAHHGSSNRDDRLLDLISGRVALISVGADNDYGHPAPALLKSLHDRGIQVHRTDEQGDVAVVSDGRGVRAVGTTQP